MTFFYTYIVLYGRTCLCVGYSTLFSDCTLTLATEMMTLSHSAFRQRLLDTAKRYPWCKVVVCDEQYTSKTCGNCGKLNETLGGNKVFTCGGCGYVADRDCSAARNILLRYLTLSRILPRPASRDQSSQRPSVPSANAVSLPTKV